MNFLPERYAKTGKAVMLMAIPINKLKKETEPLGANLLNTK
jgi:hypothetical protein